MQDVKSFDEIYQAVFDSNGNIKACGRNACKELIKYTSKTFHVSVGDEDTGFITDVDTVKKLHAECSGV